MEASSPIVANDASVPSQTRTNSYTDPANPPFVKLMEKSLSRCQYANHISKLPNRSHSKTPSHVIITVQANASIDTRPKLRYTMRQIMIKFFPNDASTFRTGFFPNLVSSALSTSYCDMAASVVTSPLTLLASVSRSILSRAIVKKSCDFIDKKRLTGDQTIQRSGEA